jgi:hypothetical protein
MVKPNEASHEPVVSLKFKGLEIGLSNMESFQWKSFINGGYIIRGKIVDPYLVMLKKFFKTENYLNAARSDPLSFIMDFYVGWSPADKPMQNRTRTRQAILVDVSILGTGSEGSWELVAIDIASFQLNTGNGSGKVYKGAVGDVIKQVIKEYAPLVGRVEVTTTLDDKEGRWAMMRQDPKTFIRSLLDWSSSVCPKKSNWVISSHDDMIVIREHNELARGKIIATYNGSWGGAPANDIISFNYVSNSVLTAVNTQLITQGISAVTGKYIDRLTESKKSIIEDTNTPNKISVGVSADRGFLKPPGSGPQEPPIKNGATPIMAVPEFSGGELGIKYEDYIDGRARNQYMNLLPMVMRVRVAVMGDVRYDDPRDLGSSVVNIVWADAEEVDAFFLGGRWVLYGFHHSITRDYFDTHLYVYRLDRDATDKDLA